MLPTFVIGLREGLEAALIVGIIAAFLNKRGRPDLVRAVFLGVGLAVLLCFGVGVALRIVESNLPQKEQEGLETLIGALAVGMVTYMIVWMKRHSRELKGQLEGAAADAVAGGRGRAMVVMAFLAVLREGFETVVFLLAVFNQSGSTSAGAAGAVLGVAVATGIGYGIYRGGVRLNLSKFFRFTGAVLVLVAAGLVASALHTGHEAGWVNAGQESTVDLSGVVEPGSVQSAFLTGMLGILPRPVLVELVGYLLYLVPVGLFVVWPADRVPSRRVARRALVAGAALSAVAALLLAVLAPGRPDRNPATAGSRLVASSKDSAVVRAESRSPAALDPTAAGTADVTLRRAGQAQRAGVKTDVYRGAVAGRGAEGRPNRITFAELTRLGGGRLPIGLQRGGGSDTVPMSYTDRNILTVWIEPRTGRIVDLRWAETVTATVTAGIGEIPLGAPIAAATSGWPAATLRASAAAARSDLADLDDHDRLIPLAGVAGVLAALFAVAALAARPRPAPAPLGDPADAPELAIR